MENPEKQTQNTKKPGPGKLLWKPGQSGNPHGRPKKERCFSDIARQLLSAKSLDIEYTFPKDGKLIKNRIAIDSNKSIHHSLCAALIREGMSGNVQAIRELIDRTEGKAKEIVSITDERIRVVAEQIETTTLPEGEELGEDSTNTN